MARAGGLAATVPHALMEGKQANNQSIPSVTRSSDTIGTRENPLVLLTTNQWDENEVRMMHAKRDAAECMHWEFQGGGGRGRR
jgi:hypothetical protein